MAAGSSLSSCVAVEWLAVTIPSVLLQLVRRIFKNIVAIIAPPIFGHVCCRETTYGE